MLATHAEGYDTTSACRKSLPMVSFCLLRVFQVLFPLWLSLVVNNAQPKSNITAQDVMLLKLRSERQVTDAQKSNPRDGLAGLRHTRTSERRYNLSL